MGCDAEEGFPFHSQRSEYEEDKGLQWAGDFLVSMRRSVGMWNGEFKRFKSHALKFLVRDRVLYRRAKQGCHRGKSWLRRRIKGRAYSAYTTNRGTEEEMGRTRTPSYYTIWMASIRISINTSDLALSARNAPLTTSISHYTLRSPP
jgi:hypothetical protein